MIGKYNTGEIETCTKCWYKNPKERGYLENLGMDRGYYTLDSAGTEMGSLSTELTFRRRIKSRLPFAGIIRRLSYSIRFQDKG